MLMLVGFKEFEFHVKLETDVLARLCWCAVPAGLLLGCPRFVKLPCLYVFLLSLAISFVNPVTWV